MNMGNMSLCQRMSFYEVAVPVAYVEVSTSVLYWCNDTCTYINISPPAPHPSSVSTKRNTRLVSVHVSFLAEFDRAPALSASRIGFNLSPSRRAAGLENEKSRLTCYQSSVHAVPTNHSMKGNRGGMCGPLQKQKTRGREYK